MNDDLMVPDDSLPPPDVDFGGVSHFLSGLETFRALVGAVESLRSLAPDVCDVVVVIGDVTVLEARYIEPHTLSFEGVDDHGHRAWVVQHFSQLNARVIYRPKRGADRVITGFAQNKI
ncbi:MAG TPA: hypothetical protein VHY30_09860 [Verrucomicrobiae bacterium]|jgi:hypothetical protein|nr:hypothetical protein [Verrucomicrobiae bacterium]